MMKLNSTTNVMTGWIHQRSVRSVFAAIAARRPTRPDGGCPPPAAGALLWTDIGPAFSCCPRRCGSYASTTYARRWLRSQPRWCGIRHYSELVELARNEPAEPSANVRSDGAGEG